MAGARKTRNQFDPAIFNYPTVEVIAATNGAEKPHVYLPVQKAAVLECHAAESRMASAERARDESETRFQKAGADTEG